MSRVKEETDIYLLFFHTVPYTPVARIGFHSVSGFGKHPLSVRWGMFEVWSESLFLSPVSGTKCLIDVGGGSAMELRSHTPPLPL